MNSSLLYYKGMSCGAIGPPWIGFRGLMAGTYRGTRSDHHTHAYDLPPQMGGCYSNRSQQAAQWSQRIDQGPWRGSLMPANQTRLEAAAEALAACCGIGRCCCS